MKANQKKSASIAIPVLLVGGTEIQTLNLVTVLVRAGYQVTVICYYEYEQSMVDRFEAFGAKVILMKFERAKGLWHLAKGLVQLFKSTKPDIVHVQYVAPGFVPVIAARVAGVKTVFATVHQPGSAYCLKAKMLLRAAARCCTAFFCVSRAVEESWFGNSELFDQRSMDRARKHFTIYNAVDVERIAEAVRRTDRKALRNSLGIGDNPVVGVVARLRAEKGHTVLLNAMVEVIKAIPDATLLIVGEGPDRARLGQLAWDLNIADHIVWIGRKSPDEIYGLYGIMDVVAVPSLFEGFGLSAAEAMAAEVPVVASRVGGLTEVIEDAVSGYLVTVGEKHALKTALINLLSDSGNSQSMGRKGRESVLEHYSLERFRRSILLMYQC